MRFLLDNLPELESRLPRNGKTFIGLDYDGTLSAIAETPNKAFLAPPMRGALSGLAKNPLYERAIVSGRSLAKIKQLVDIPGFAYIGNHGFEIESPVFSRTFTDAAWQDKLDAVCSELDIRLSDIEGTMVERKGPTASIHFRRVTESRVAEVKTAFKSVMSKYDGLRFTEGKEVFELRPPFDMNKGKAVLQYLDALFGNGWEADVFLLYVGDDNTDEDVFRIIGENGAGVIVADTCVTEAETAARFHLRDIEDVRALIHWLASR